MTENSRRRGGALLAQALHAKGVDHVFTLAGGFCNPALEGFMECQMPVINCPHEQVAGHLADGHTRITLSRVHQHLSAKVPAASKKLMMWLLRPR